MADDSPAGANPPAMAPSGNSGASKIALTGGILGALGASACCVLPLALTLLGVGGAWMANLRAMAPYQPFFLALAVVSLGYGFYQVYWKPGTACTGGEACAKPLPNRFVKTGLWLGTFIVVVALIFPLWFPLILPYLP